MHALVVYESMFGNTQQIAEAIAGGLAMSGHVDTVEVGVAPAEIPADVDLVVVGGPTHAFGMSRATTRDDARRQGATASASTGIREWIAGIGHGSARVPVATFDTKVTKPRLPGSAARSAERTLRKLRFPVLTKARTFLVGGMQGPVQRGEVDRARDWGQDLAALVAARPARR